MDDPSQRPSLLEQTRLHTASIATLASKVDELTSSVARLSAESASQAATIAHLSSENAQLRTAQRNQHQVNAELLGKVFEDGVMLWEGSDVGRGTRSDQGTWVWSAERYKVVEPISRIAASATLSSLPVELIRSVIDPLPKDQHPSLCLVSYRLLSIVSRLLYNNFAAMRWETAFDFVCDRLERYTEKSARVSPLLLPEQLTFTGEAPTYLDSWVDARLRPGSSSTLRVNSVLLSITTADQFASWTPLLAHLDPRRFYLLTGSRATHHRVRPTAHRLASYFLVDSFAANWTRLEHVYSRGPGLVLLLPGSGPARLAFASCQQRCARVAPASDAAISVCLDKHVNGQKIQRQGQAERDLGRLHAGGSQAAHGETQYTLSVAIA